jgi:hypothetical protein
VLLIQPMVESGEKLEYWVGEHSHNEIVFRNGFPLKNRSRRGL